MLARLKASSAAMRSISGASEVMPGRRFSEATTSASSSNRREGERMRKYPGKHGDQPGTLHRHPTAGKRHSARLARIFSVMAIICW